MQLSVEKIASYALQDPNYPEIELSQVAHRIELIKAWEIPAGSRVLEIGCGQGNCTTVLAEAVGPSGHIDAVDPAPSDYGAPFTLAQAQAHITASEVGSRITWHQADPVNFIQSQNEPWDITVLSHCIWYFQSPATLKTILEKLMTKTKRICIAEYALHASELGALPHVLAALTRATLEAHKKESNENIQSPLSPTGIKDIVKAFQKFQLQHESIIVPEAGLSDGQWEAGTVAHESFLEEVTENIQDQRVSLLIQSMRDSVLSSIAKIGKIKDIRTMDVWAASFGIES